MLISLRAQELKAQVTEAGVTQYIQILALYVKLGHALPYNPQEQITMQAMAELKQVRGTRETKKRFGLCCTRRAIDQLWSVTFPF